MFSRSLMTAALVGLLAAAALPEAHAQQPASPASQPATQSGWTFNVAPYLWLPTINTTLNFPLPPALDGKVPTEVSAGPGDYLPKLNFAGMLAADAQYGRFSILTDFIYMNLSAKGTHIKSVDFVGLPSTPISRSVQLGASLTLKATVWTLAGGYTVLRGDWGNLDVLVGLRYLGIDARTNYNLALTLTPPNRGGATFGGGGSLSGNGDIWNGIGGFRGRIRLGDTGLFVPYYFDIGAGGSNLTWQVASGLGYQTGWAGVSLTYRYLSFEQGSGALVQHLSMGGPMVMVNFSF